MIVWLVIGLVLAGGLLMLLGWWANTNVASAKRGLFWAVMAVCVLLAGILALTGKAIMGVLPFAFAGWRMWRLGRNASGGWQQQKFSNQHNQKTAGSMTRADALQVLGLREGATKAEIQEAYRAAMAKYHPDKGGNDWMAAKINEARKTLLG